MLLQIRELIGLVQAVDKLINAVSTRTRGLCSLEAVRRRQRAPAIAHSFKLVLEQAYLQSIWLPISRPISTLRMKCLEHAWRWGREAPDIGELFRTGWDGGLRG